MPRTSRRIDDTAFSVAEPRAWNWLPTQLKLPRSTTTFRRQLKTFFVCHMDTGEADDRFLASAFHKVTYVAAGKTRFYVFKNQHLEISKI